MTTEEELAAARRAIQLDREHIALRFYEVRALAALGRIEEVRARLNDALLLPPDNIPTGQLFSITAEELQAHGHEQAAREILLRGIEWFQNQPAEQHQLPNFRADLGRALYQAGEWGRADSLFADLAAEYPDRAPYQGYLGMLAARRNDHGEAERIIQVLEGMKKQPYGPGGPAAFQARIAAPLGQKERAMNFLREHINSGRLTTGISYHQDRDLAWLRDLPAFQALLRPSE